MDIYSTETTPYELLGGAETIRRLVNSFYSKVRKHPDLAPIFPGDWEETARKQYLFLTQFLGGPDWYSKERGHPRLRARHMPFAITPKRRDAWLACMREAMDEVGLQGPMRDYFYQRLEAVSLHMINTPDTH
jgi:hemoglobin